jgi:predicted Ser/Thr protein kinase
MTEAPQKFLDLVDGQLSSARHAALTWEGSFEEYLAIVEERPWVRAQRLAAAARHDREPRFRARGQERRAALEDLLRPVQRR